MVTVKVSDWVDVVEEEGEGEGEERNCEMILEGRWDWEEEIERCWRENAATEEAAMATMCAKTIKILFISSK